MDLTTIIDDTLRAAIGGHISGDNVHLQLLRKNNIFSRLVLRSPSGHYFTFSIANDGTVATPVEVSAPDPRPTAATFASSRETDHIARQNLLNHFASDGSHEQYIRQDSMGRNDKLLFASPDGNIWTVSVNNQGDLIILGLGAPTAMRKLWRLVTRGVFRWGR